MSTDQLRQERQSLESEAERLLERSEGVGALAGADRERFEAVTHRIGELNSQIEDRMARTQALARGGPGITYETGDGARGAGETRAAHYGSINTNRGVHADPWDYLERGAQPDDLRARGLAAVERTPVGEDHARQAATRLVEGDTEAGNPAARWILASANPAYFAAVSKMFRDPERGFLEWTEAERASFVEAKTFERNMALTGGGTASFMAPYSIDPAVILTNTSTISSIRKVARVEQIVSYAQHFVSSAGSTASWDGEGVEVSDDSPTLSAPTVTAYKGAAFVGASIEAVGDMINAAAEISKIMVDAADRLTATAFISGTGSSQPYGSVTQLNNTTASRVSVQTNGSFGAIDVYSVLESLPARHRMGASFHASLPMINRMRRFSEALGYNSSFLVDMSAESPPRLLGKPLYEDSDMTASLSVATASSDSIVMIGDFRNFVICDRVGTSIEFVPHLFSTSNGRPTGSRGWYMYFRTGSDWLNVDAGRILQA